MAFRRRALRRPSRQFHRSRFASSRTRLFGTVAVAASATLGLTTLATQEGCADKASPPSAQAPVVIGVSLGLSGNFKDFSTPQRSAIVVAEGEINAHGGILGRPLRFDVQDDLSSERDDIARVAQGFVDRNVVAVIGPLGSSQVVRTQDIFLRSATLQICPTATSTELTIIQPKNDRFLFRTTPADDFQGAAVMLLAARTPFGLLDGGVPIEDAGDAGDAGGTGPGTTCERLAIVNIDNSYGNPMADLVENFWPRREGRVITLRKRISKELQADYQIEASEIIATTPQCLALIAYDDVAAQFLRDFRADPGFPGLGSRFFFIGTDGIYTDGLLKNGAEDTSDLTSPNVAEGVFGTNPDTQPGTKEYNEFRTIFSSYFPLGDRDAPSFSANTFDAAVLLALAIQRAGTTVDRKAIRDSLLAVARGPGRPVTPGQIGEALQAIKNGEDIDYKGASGNVDFDESGNVTAGFIVWQAARNPATRALEFRTVGRFPVEELLEQTR